VKVQLRPLVREFLQEMSKYFELMVFTASLDSYAEAVVKVLDPDRSLFQSIFSRESCIVGKEGAF